MAGLAWGGLPLAAFGLLSYGLVLGPLQSLPRAQEDDHLRVVMPGYIEVLLAGGDRHLAANIGVFRAMMIGGDVKDELTYEVQAKVQRQVAILNPRQEDNSYVAAAILPWWGQVADAQFILDRATKSRDWDFMPPFYQGFNEYYFNKNYERAAELVQLSASRTDGVNRESFKAVAAKWISLGAPPLALCRHLVALCLPLVAQFFSPLEICITLVPLCLLLMPLCLNLVALSSPPLALCSSRALCLPLVALSSSPLAMCRPLMHLCLPLDPVCLPLVALSFPPVALCRPLLALCFPLPGKCSPPISL